MTKVMQETYGNPSSIHSHGRQAGKLLREARQDVSPLTWNQTSTYLFFSSGGTESNNTAIIIIVSHHQDRKKHIITQLLNTILCLKPSITWCNILALKRLSSNQ